MALTPINRKEEWFKEIVDAASGSGGTSDYTDLENKPSINGVTLSGNKTLADLGQTFLVAENGILKHTFAETEAAIAEGKSPVYQLVSGEKLTMTSYSPEFKMVFSSFDFPESYSVIFLASADSIEEYDGVIVPIYWKVNAQDTNFLPATTAMLSLVNSVMTTAITELAAEPVGTTKAYSGMSYTADNTAAAVVLELAGAFTSGYVVDIYNIPNMGRVRFRVVQGWYNNGDGSVSFNIAYENQNAYGVFGGNLIQTVSYSNQKSTYTLCGTVGKLE